ncbi:hypothetical protein LSCM1_06739 [Leishmania martiniquensis]|uniref:Uncharacterized protein n=1 Tax=Leishmania martiniquensis TaxID=1580590 RepID=A0A836GFK1_9TRYP|nr:hypothetical protein LSCM1_06739 [Leishmania martiniquensis]
MEYANGPAAGQAAAAAATTPSPSPQVRFKAQVLKLGTDGSSLPRLVVVTDTYIYVCVPSGGITRIIAVCRIGRVTLSQHEVAEASKDGAVAGGSGSRGPTAPSVSPHRGKPISAFNSVFTVGGGTSGRTEVKTLLSGRTDCAEDDIGGTSEGSSPGASVASSSFQGSTFAATESRGEASATAAAVRWLTIVTLGLTQEATLALQFCSAVDGEDFVAALRKGVAHVNSSGV